MSKLSTLIIPFPQRSTYYKQESSIRNLKDTITAKQVFGQDIACVLDFIPSESQAREFSTE